MHENGKPRELEVFERTRSVLANMDAMAHNFAPASRLWEWGVGSERGIRLAADCGYPQDCELTPRYYWNVYRRWALASRANDLWPDECWAVYPEVYETENPNDATAFEDGIASVFRRTAAFHFLHLGDRVSRLGRFGLLFLGLDDGGDPAKPPSGIRSRDGLPVGGKRQERKLMFVRAFSELSVTVGKIDADVHSPRFGWPSTYAIDFAGKESMDATPMGGASQTTEVHWTRVVHLADNTNESVLYGRPSLEAVIDDLWDMRKVSGGSGEMFWKGGFPGYAFTANPNVPFGGATVNDDLLRETVAAYVKGTQRYLSAVNGEWKSLTPQVATPDAHLHWYTTKIAATLGVPVRIFLGSEAGHLASTQDDATWRSRCVARQKRYLEPLVLRPFVDRLVALGCVPPPKNVDTHSDYKVTWRDLRALSDTERADVALKKTQSLTDFVTGGVGQVFPLRIFLTLVFGLTEEEADAVDALVKSQNKDDLPLPPAGLLPEPSPTAKVGPGSGSGQRADKTAPKGRGRGSSTSGRGSI